MLKQRSFPLRSKDKMNSPSNPALSLLLLQQSWSLEIYKVNISVFLIILIIPVGGLLFLLSK